MLCCVPLSSSLGVRCRTQTPKSRASLPLACSGKKRGKKGDTRLESKLEGFLHFTHSLFCYRRQRSNSPRFANFYAYKVASDMGERRKNCIILPPFFSYIPYTFLTLTTCCIMPIIYHERAPLFCLREIIFPFVSSLNFGPKFTRLTPPMLYGWMEEVNEPEITSRLLPSFFVINY